MTGQGEPWLVVIDVQRIFGEPPSPWAAPRFAEVLPVIRDLVDRYAGCVVFTRFEPVKPEGSWVDYYERWPFALEPATRASYDLVLDPGDAPVVSRPTMGKYGSDLLAATAGSRNLVLCGVSTDCCVLSTPGGRRRRRLGPRRTRRLRRRDGRRPGALPGRDGVLRTADRGRRLRRSLRRGAPVTGDPR